MIQSYHIKIRDYSCRIVPYFRIEKEEISLYKEKIPYMLTGSLVSSFHGNTRSTHDIDIIISITGDNVPARRIIIMVQAFRRKHETI
jgi:hypothetical protein